MHSSVLVLGALWCLPLLLIGCSSPSRAVDADRSILGFITPGVTTREDVLFELGMPLRSYEDGRIIGYALGVDDENRLVVRSTIESQYVDWTDHLGTVVLVFDGGNRVARYRFVPLGNHPRASGEPEPAE